MSAITTNKKTQDEIKKIIILYRAVHVYCQSSIQSTIRFLFPKIQSIQAGKCFKDNARTAECGSAITWWDLEVDTETKTNLEVQYKIAAKQP